MLLQCVIDYIINRYLLYNNDPDADPESIDKEYAENFANILNIDEEEIDKLKKDIHVLSVQKEKQMKQLNEQGIKNDELKNQINILQNEISSFYDTKEEHCEDLNCEIDLLKTRRNKLVESIATKRENIVNLTETINNQPCTFEEKKKILKHIEEMKHTIDLKKEKIKQQKFLKEEYELKLAEAKKKVQTEVYRLNNSLMKLTILKPELKVLHLKEEDFLSQNFSDDIETLPKNIKIFENQIKEEISDLKPSLHEIKQERSLLEGQVENLTDELRAMNEEGNFLISEIKKINLEIENITKREEEQKKEFEEKIKKVEESAPNLKEVRQRLMEIRQLKKWKGVDFNTKKEQSLDFFVKLDDIISGNLIEMNNIRTDIYDILTECLVKIDSLQNEMIADLHHLDELRDN